MYDFFRLLSSGDVDVNLTDFQSMYYRYSRALEPVEKICSVSAREMKKEQFEAVESELTKLIIKVYCDFSNDPYFKHIMKNDYEKYMAKQNVSNVRPCLSATKVRGILAAYKLFYVGCSRAKKSLSIVVDREKIYEYSEAFVRKMSALGFDVLET